MKISILILSVCLVLPGLSREWESLFNGTNLVGWTSTEETTGCWSVVDGAIRASNGPSHLFFDTDKPFRDFAFEAQVKTEAMANSGIYLCTQFQKSGWPEAGFEAQINCSNGDARKSGSLSDRCSIWVPPVKPGKEHLVPHVWLNASGELLSFRPEAPHEDNEWFTYSIRVRGKLVETRINGQIVVRYTMKDEADLPPGTFALQAHDPLSTTWFKDLKVMRF